MSDDRRGGVGRHEPKVVANHDITAHCRRLLVNAPCKRIVLCAAQQRAVYPIAKPRLTVGKGDVVAWTKNQRNVNLAQGGTRTGRGLREHGQREECASQCACVRAEGSPSLRDSTRCGGSTKATTKIQHNHASARQNWTHKLAKVVLEPRSERNMKAGSEREGQEQTGLDVLRRRGPAGEQ